MNYIFWITPTIIYKIYFKVNTQGLSYIIKTQIGHLF